MSEPQSSESKKKRRKKKAKRELRVIDWRARVDLPDFGLEGGQVKVDTGARTSSLHATHIRHFTKDGAEWVRFRVHTGKRGARVHTAVEAPLLDCRNIRSSNGAVEERIVIATRISTMGLTWDAEVTLAKRGSMAFPMLLGRACLRERFLVDSGRSYIKPRPPIPVLPPKAPAPQPPTT